MNKDELKKLKTKLEEKDGPLTKNAISHAIFELGFKSCNNCKDTCEAREESGQCLQEKMYYHAIVEQLKEDLKKIQLEPNFAAEVIMGEIAMTLVRMNRLHRFEICSNLIVRESIDFESKINPVYEYIIRFQNHLNKLMSKLGIMPLQLLGRRTTKIAESLEMELSKLQTETLETKSTGTNLRLKDKKILEKPIES